MTDLFEHQLNTGNQAHAPLARRMRPRALDEVVGQRHLLGEGKILRRIIESGRITSLFLYGPPGTGKTAIANLIAQTTDSVFEQMNAVTAGIADIRKASEEAKQRLAAYGRRTLLFVDELHRFNKTQQDALLPDVEDGRIILIGATTQNPSFYINSALISRSNLFELGPLAREDLMMLLRRALKDEERGLGRMKIEAEESALSFICAVADGDARRALGGLEVAVLTTPPDKKTGVVHLTEEVAREAIQKKAARYDKDQDVHYDTISAFIKSVRGGDPDAAVYWISRMMSAGEDPRFIARRLVILASEDIGCADPLALSVAVAAHQAAELIGMPEGQLVLAQAAVYLACAPKSNASSLAVWEAMHDVEEGTILEVPAHLRGKGSRLSREKAHLSGQEIDETGYVYPHSFPGHFTPQEYLPSGKRYFAPSDEGYERIMGERLIKWWGERFGGDSKTEKTEEKEEKRGKE